MKQFRLAKKRITVSVGESVRIIRELQVLSPNQLAQRTGIPQATLSAIENDRVRLGVERARVLARALKCHPAVLVFPAPSPFGRGLGRGTTTAQHPLPDPLPKGEGDRSL